MTKDFYNQIDHNIFSAAELFLIFKTSEFPPHIICLLSLIPLALLSVLNKKKRKKSK